MKLRGPAAGIPVAEIIVNRANGMELVSTHPQSHHPINRPSSRSPLIHIQFYLRFLRLDKLIHLSSFSLMMVVVVVCRQLHHHHHPRQSQATGLPHKNPITEILIYFYLERASSSARRRRRHIRLLLTIRSSNGGGRDRKETPNICHQTIVITIVIIYA